MFHVPAKPSNYNGRVKVSDSFRPSRTGGIHCSVCARAKILSPRGRLAEGGGAMLPGPAKRTMYAVMLRNLIYDDNGYSLERYESCDKVWYGIEKGWKCL